MKMSSASLSGRNGLHGSMPDIELPELPPELALVIACSRWPLRESEEREIRARVAAPIDWNKFLAWVRRNRIAPLVYHNLQQTASPLVPESVVLQLQNEFSRNRLRVIMQIAEAARISRLLADAGIRSMVIKGPVLSQLAFGDPILRESGDIDIVIDPARVPEADRMIIKAGYRRLVPDAELPLALYETYRRRRCQFAYYLQTRDSSLELHWRLSTNSLLMPLDARISWNRSEPVHVAGADFVTLPDEELFLYLCVHGSVHMWFRLKWLADIAALLQQLHPEVIDRIASRSRVLGLDRSFHQAMILAHKLMVAPVPPEVLTRAYRNRTARQLAIAACRALNWHESPEEPIETQWFSAWVNWHAFGLQPGLRFRWRELQNQMFSPEDFARVRLPKQLFFLYLPLRPLSWAIRNAQRLLMRS
jgi:Uncharacterised nucleotidyltransferase